MSPCKTTQTKHRNKHIKQKSFVAVSVCLEAFILKELCFVLLLGSLWPFLRRGVLQVSQR